MALGVLRRMSTHDTNTVNEVLGFFRYPPKTVIWVAARFGCADSIWSMTVKEILFWYEGHMHMYNEEIERHNKMMGKKNNLVFPWLPR